jgi:hypothetical protein
MGLSDSLSVGQLAETFPVNVRALNLDGVFWNGQSKIKEQDIWNLE